MTTLCPAGDGCENRYQPEKEAGGTAHSVICKSRYVPAMDVDRSKACRQAQVPAAWRPDQYFCYVARQGSIHGFGKSFTSPVPGAVPLPCFVNIRLQQTGNAVPCRGQGKGHEGCHQADKGDKCHL